MGCTHAKAIGKKLSITAMNLKEIKEEIKLN
jgi:hypothetical protein